MNQLQIPCLGLPFKLGMLYDYRASKLIPDKTLWSHETLQKLSSTKLQESSRFELVSEDTFSQKAFLLGADDTDLQLSLLSGLVHAEGAAQVLYDHTTSKNMSRVILNCKSKKHFEQLTLDPLNHGMVDFPEVLEEDIATHVVTGVVYGADAFFVFDQKVDKDDDLKAVQENIEQKIQKLLSLDGMSNDGSASLIAENKGDKNKHTCKYYGDVALTNNPTTFQEAIQVCRELPDLMKGKAVANKVFLLPLAGFESKCQKPVCEVSSPLILDLFEYLNEVEVQSNDLMQSEACLCFTGISKELHSLKSLVNAHTLSVKTKIATLLPQVRAGKVPVTKLEDVVKLSPFCQKILSSLIDEKVQEIRYLEQFLVFFEQQEVVHFAFRDGELDTIFDINDARDIICFDFNIHWGNHDVLKTMEAHLQDEKVNKKKTNTLRSEPWHTGRALETIQNRMQLFAGHVKANRDRQGVKYVVTNGQSTLAKQATDDVAVISLYQDPASPTSFEPLSPPGKPIAENVTSDSVKLIWEVPKHGSKNIISYTVNYSYEPKKCLDVKFIQDRCDPQTVTFTVSSLIPNTTYHFAIRAENAHGNSPYSSVSDSITTKPRVILKEKYLPCCELIDGEKSPKVYKLPTHETFKSELIEKRDALSPCSPVSAAVPQKVVMLVGSTGSGKTTLINAMVNYILGVKWEDDYRYKLIAENTSGDQSKSQTKVITAYTFHNEEDFPFPYSLTVIDTPGFGDTEGLERDKKITAQIKEFFCTENGIDQLHAVGFVVQSSLARLTPTQKYVFNAILSIFGKDIAGNIFLMTTFADGDKPQVLDAIKKAEVPSKGYYEFNNSALYVNKSRRVKFNVPFWDMGIESFQDFFDEVRSLEACSLQLTQEVLTERQHLEACLEGLQPQIQAGLSERSKLEKTKREIEQREAEMCANKDFSIKVKVTKRREVPLKDGLFTTTCMQCNYPCHLHCTISDDDKKHKCASMTWFTRKVNTTCTVCPHKCSWTVHKNTPFWYEFYEAEETLTLKEILGRYEVAESSKNKLEDIIKELDKRIAKIDDTIVQMLQQTRYSLNRLQEIALRPNPMTQEEYIKILIEAEEQEHKLGWQDRVKGLEDAKKKASLITKVEKGDLASIYPGLDRSGGDPHGKNWLIKAHCALDWFGKQVGLDKIV